MTKIDDEMVKRFYEAYCRNDWPVFSSVAPRIRDGLEAALNRRTGPKCRRVEYDDYTFWDVPKGYKRSLTKVGRRATDTSWTLLPRKSTRLSPKPEPEIEVSEGMERAGVTAGLDYEATCPAFPTRWPYAIVRAIYRAMESTRLKEAAYAAKSALKGASAGAPVKETGGGVAVGIESDTHHFHRRKKDIAPNDVAVSVRAHRRKDDPI